MPQATFHFPKGFLWGAATASHQVEGNNANNNWYAWETTPGKIINGHRSGLACDWWGGRWQEDFDRAAETGQNAHRLSIEWSRIQPTPDTWDNDALDHYVQMVRGLTQRNITPLVTLHHFSDPLWLSEMGGWENDQASLLFEKYTIKVVEALKDHVTMWCTINEPNVYHHSGYMEGSFPPGKSDIGAGFRVLVNMVRGHAVAYHTIHKIQPEARVGSSFHYRSFAPARKWFPPDAWMAKIRSQVFNNSFPNALINGKIRYLYASESVPQAKNTQDFVGVNYYTREMVSFALKPANLFATGAFPKGAAVSDTGFIANVPAGFTEALYWANRFNKPIIVTENGIENENDNLRPRYLLEHLHQLWRVALHNVPIKGYFHWSLVDNFEWERGWTQRFGLWGLNVDTQERIRRSSVDLYAAICKENGISSEIVEKYCPEICTQLFPE